MKKFLLLVLVCLLAGLTACSSAKEADPNLGQPGETVLIGNYHNVIPCVYKDQGLYDPSDPAGPKEMQDLETKGAAYLPDQGTRAKVISVFKRGGPQNDGRLVEILEGKYQGKQGYITYKCLAKP